MDETTTHHIITIDQRNSGYITGVTSVISFDENTVILDTCQGMLSMKGNGLHVNKLNIEQGQISVDGQIDSITYSQSAKEHEQSLFTRWFK